jgi:DNA polymerase-3 subunit gamma/tau
MSYISFYRKWRPQSFDEIIGQEYNIRTIRNAVSSSRLSHCYIFCGPRGTGKTSTARILAKALNCVKGVTPDPCNKCENCISISNGSSMDVIEIDAASNRGIDEIRELREKVKYLPSALRKKVYIIDEVHMLTTEAFNALLKVLEEPPEHVIFIMATTEPNKVIPTIMSRCQRFDFLPIPMDRIKERLIKISKNEKINISDSAVNLISKYADGSLRDADGILEQLAAFGEDKIKVADVTALLGITELDMLFEFTDILIGKNMDRGLLLVNKIISSNQNLKIFVSELIDHMYELYVIKNYSKPFEILNVSGDFKDRYTAQAEKLKKEELEFYIELFTELLKQIKWGEGSKVFFKSAVIKAVNFIMLDEKSLAEKTRFIEARVEKLREDVDRIDLMQKEGGDHKSKKPGTGSDAYENQDDDFDIIKSDEIDEMVKEAGISDKSNKGRKVVSAAGGMHAEEEKKGREIGVIISNLDKICLSLKKKKISVYAMFTEASPYRVEDGTVYFLLDEKKEWHKDHLNKKSNAELISGVIREVTGKDFRVMFETSKKADKAGRDSSEGDKTIEKTEDKGDDTTAGKEIKEEEDTDPAGKGMKTGGTEDVLNYFEKKFDIKE